MSRLQSSEKHSLIDTQRTSRQKEHSLPQEYANLMIVRPMSVGHTNLKTTPKQCDASKKKLVFKIVERSKPKVPGDTTDGLKTRSCEVVEENLTSQTSEDVGGQEEKARLCYKCPFNNEYNLNLGEHDEKNERQGSRWRYVCPICTLNCDEVSSSVPDVWNHFLDHPCFLKYNVQCTCTRRNRNGRWIRDHDRNLDVYMDHLHKCHKEESSIGNVLFEVLLDPLLMTKMVERCEWFGNLTDFFMHLKMHLHVMNITLLCRHCVKENPHDEPFGNPLFLKEDYFLEHLATVHSGAENTEPVLISIQLNMCSRPETELSHPEPEVKLQRQLSQKAKVAAAELDRKLKSKSNLKYVKENDPLWELPYISCPCFDSGCCFMTHNLLLLGQHIEKHLHPMGMRWVAVCRLCCALLPGMVSAAHHILSKHSAYDSGVICLTQLAEERSAQSEQRSPTSLEELLTRKSSSEKSLSPVHLTIYQRSAILLKYVQAAGHHPQEEGVVPEGAPVVTLSRLGVTIVVRPQVQNFNDYNEWKFWVGSGSKWKIFPIPEFLKQKLKQSGNASIVFTTTRTDGSTSEESSLEMYNHAAKSGKHILSLKTWSHASRLAKQHCQEKVDYIEEKHLKQPSKQQNADSTAGARAAGQPEESSAQEALQLGQSETGKTTSRLSKELVEQQFKEKINYLTEKYLQPTGGERTVTDFSGKLQEALPETREKEKAPTKTKRRKLEALDNNCPQDIADSSSGTVEDSYMQLFLALGKAQYRCGIQCMFQAKNGLIRYKADGEVLKASQLAPVDTSVTVMAKHRPLNTRIQQYQLTMDHCPDHNKTLRAELELTVVGIGANAFFKEFVVMKEMVTDTVFQCPYCVFTRLIIGEVACHIAVMHDAKEIAAVRSMNQAVYSTIKCAFLYCRYCSFVTPHLLSMWRHFQNIHQFRMPLAPLKGSLHLSSQGGLACCKCDFITAIHAGMVQHVEENHAENLDIFKLGYVVCHAKVQTQPAKMEASSGSMQRLLAAPVQHTVLAFLCQHCERRFTSIWSMESHCFEAHGEGIIFFCTECDATFEDRNLIREHMTLHGSDNCSVGLAAADKRHVYVVTDVETEPRDSDPLVSDEQMEDTEDQCVVSIEGQDLCLPLSCLHRDVEQQLQSGHDVSRLALIPLYPDANPDLEQKHQSF